MINYIAILEHNHVYNYYFNNRQDNLNTASFCKRNMKQTVRIGSAISGLYNKSYSGNWTLNHYININTNAYFTRFRFANSIKHNFQKLRNNKNN